MHSCTCRLRVHTNMQIFRTPFFVTKLLAMTFFYFYRKANVFRKLGNYCPFYHTLACFQREFLRPHIMNLYVSQRSQASSPFKSRSAKDLQEQFEFRRLFIVYLPVQARTPRTILQQLHNSRMTSNIYICSLPVYCMMHTGMFELLI